MRLHSLTLRAFGPFATEQSVDFDRLSESGLFLLEGPTGVGKTTILDAITFAIYGGLTGTAGAASDRLHSHFADPNVEPRVVLDFSVGDARHRVTRSPEWQRPKKRGDGFTRAQAQVHLERWSHGTWRSLSSNKAEVGEELTELIGLNRDQFTQVVLLPQGEFARFLRSGDDERRELLTRLFGTELYDRITEQLAQRRVVAGRALDEARERTSRAIAAAAEAAGLDPERQLRLHELDHTVQRAELTQLRDLLARQQLEASTEVTVAADECAAATLIHQQNCQLVDLLTRLESAYARLDAHAAGREDHLSEAARLGSARRGAPLAALIELLDDQIRVVTQRRREALAADPQVGSRLVAAIEALREDTDADALAEVVADLARQARHWDHTATSLSEMVEIEHTLPQRRDTVTVAQERADVAIKRRRHLEDRRSELPELLTHLRDDLATAREARSNVVTMTAQRDRLKAQLSAARDAEILRSQLTGARLEQQTATEAHLRAVEKHLLLVELRLSGMAAELAGTLAPGHGCVVCGSSDHPHPAPPTLDLATAADVATAAHARAVAESARNTSNAEVAELDRRYTGAVVGAGGDSTAVLIDRVETNATLLTDLESLAGEIDGIVTRLTEREVEQNRLTDQLDDAVRTEAGAELALVTATADLVTADSGVHDAQDSFDSVLARQLDARGRAQALASLGLAVDGLSRASTALTEMARRADAGAQGAGFTDLAAARAALLGPAALLTLQERVSGWRELDAQLSATVAAPEFAGLDRADLQAARAAATTTAEQLSTAQQRDHDARAALAHADHRLNRFSERSDQVIAAIRGQQQTATANQVAVHLADLAKGTVGQRRVTLSTYVLRHWFAQVVDAANLRLAAMSSGRYRLVRTDVGAHKRERSGLTLSVIDEHTGEQRSTASLSGGETFYTSLALALGLADVVKAEAGGVELDTLFIDEGFGSLDTETLDQVMAVIDDLRDRGRVVGVVSHVAELKDRIGERLEIRRLVDGSSRVRLVA
jgi:exonuclease SbcC